MAKNHTEPSIVKPEDVDPRYDWKRPIMNWGPNAVDFEERLDFRRLHRYRLGRTRNALRQAGLGSLLCFDQYNIRYMTSTVIGNWAQDKFTRYSLLPGTGEPHVWDFGSAAKHHRMYAPWLKPHNCHAGMLGLRGAVAPKIGLMRSAAEEIKSILKENGVASEPVGVDVVEPAMMFELQAVGLNVVDGQQAMLDAREIKSNDEITLLNMSAAIVDGCYQTIAEALKPGVRENEIVGLANKRLYELGSDDVEAINAISGERCNPHPHNFTDRLIRPGDQAFFDIIQSVNGYRTCYYRTFNVGHATESQRDAYKKAREWIDRAIEMVKPGVMTDQIAAAWPKAEEIGFSSEMECFGLLFGHGLGLGLHERPIISRLNSFDDPQEIKEGMVFALETYCPASDGFSAARIEEEVVCTPTGARIITLYPAETLPIANPY
jgi:Xaa-Pro dipeptidase